MVWDFSKFEITKDPFDFQVGEVVYFDLQNSISNWKSKAVFMERKENIFLFQVEIWVKDNIYVPAFQKNPHISKFLLLNLNLKTWRSASNPSERETFFWNVASSLRFNKIISQDEFELALKGAL
jgi:hypothetical protein